MQSQQVQIEGAFLKASESLLPLKTLRQIARTEHEVQDELAGERAQVVDFRGAQQAAAVGGRDDAQEAAFGWDFDGL